MAYLSSKTKIQTIYSQLYGQPKINIFHREWIEGKLSDWVYVFCPNDGYFGYWTQTYDRNTMYKAEKELKHSMYFRHPKLYTSILL